MLASSARCRMRQRWGRSVRAHDGPDLPSPQVMGDDAGRAAHRSRWTYAHNERLGYPPWRAMVKRPVTLLSLPDHRTVLFRFPGIPSSHDLTCLSLGRYVAELSHPAHPAERTAPEPPGALACLLAALFTGVLLGRMADPVPAGHIYLNEASPPPHGEGLRARPARSRSRCSRRCPGRAPRCPAQQRQRQAHQEPGRRPDPGLHRGRPHPRARRRAGAQEMPGAAAKVVRLTNAVRAKHGLRPASGPTPG